MHGRGDELTIILDVLILQQQNCAPGYNMETEKPHVEASIHIFVVKKSNLLIKLFWTTASEIPYSEHTYGKIV